MPDLIWMLTWSFVMALVALAYGQYVGARRAQGRPLSPGELVRNLLILHAIAIGLLAATSLRTSYRAFPMLPRRVVVTMLMQLAVIPLVPVAIWYGFALPLRLTRYLTRARRVEPGGPHPLDGAWPREASFLDRIAEARDPATGARAGSIHPPSTALDRIGRLAAGRSSGPDPERPHDGA